MTKHRADEPRDQTDESRERERTDGDPDRLTEMPKAGWIAILRRSVKQFKHDDITDRAAALTYFGVLAIFPGILVLTAILGLLGHDTTRKLLDNVDQVAPGGVTSFLGTVIDQVQGKGGAAGLALVLGLALALWSSSGYVAGFMRAANAIYDIDEGRPLWKTIRTRLLVTVALLVMLVVTALLVIVTGPIASQLGKVLGIGNTTVLVWEIAKWPVLLVIVSLMLSLLYRACPNVKQPGMRWISPGGVIAVVLWIAASALFALYVSFSGSYNKTYGSFATVIVFLVWLWITNIVVLLGAEFNAEMQHERLIRAGLPDDLEPFVELRDTTKLDDQRRREAEHAEAVRERSL